MGSCLCLCEGLTPRKAPFHLPPHSAVHHELVPSNYFPSYTLCFWFLVLPLALPSFSKPSPCWLFQPHPCPWSAHVRDLLGDLLGLWSLSQPRFQNLRLASSPREIRTDLPSGRFSLADFCIPGVCLEDFPGNMDGGVRELISKTSASVLLFPKVDGPKNGPERETLPLNFPFHNHLFTFEKSMSLMHSKSDPWGDKPWQEPNKIWFISSFNQGTIIVP